MNADDKTALEVLTAITGILFTIGFWIRRKEGSVHQWPQTTGKIVKCEAIRSPPRPGEEAVEPIIEYEFEYQGKSFKTSHWRFANYSVGNRLSADAVMSRYPLGSIVTVFINTRRPERSALEAGTSSLCWVLFGFGLLFLFIISMVLLSLVAHR